MRKQLLCSVAAIAITTALSGPVVAADIPMKARPAPAPAVYAPTWAGLYLGGHLGYGTSKFRAPGIAGSGTGSEVFPATTLKPSGFLLGLHAGYNWQAGAWVFGIEGDVTVTPWGRKKWSRTIGSSSGGLAELHGLASIRGRLGWAFDRSLIYATGGVAFAKKTSAANTSLHDALNVPDANNKTGWVFGGGIEWKYNPAMSLRLEGLHYMFNEKTVDQVLIDQGKIPAWNGIRSATVVRVGASWHFDGGDGWGKGPVATRY